jgi:hypothetical protein
MLVGDGVDLQAQAFVELVDDRVREAIEVIHAQPVLTLWTTKRVLDEQVTDTLELGEEASATARLACLAW